MGRSRLRRTGALLTTATLLAMLTATTAAGPVTAAGKASCQGLKATIVGTDKRDVILGTDGPDVIAGLGGNDVINGRGGNDLICGGPGRDRITGVAGRDRLYGNGGPDRLIGGPAADLLFGGTGDDLLSGRTGNDRLNGGPGTDTCYQDAGSGLLVSCELPAAPPPPPSLIPMSGILAVAYSDIDGLDGYSTGDVLIARLVDTSGDGQPGAGDTVEMGRYPLNLDATAFGDWTVRSHVASAAGNLSATIISVTPSALPAQFAWVRDGMGEHYFERGNSIYSSEMQDGFTAGGLDDSVRAVAVSPSVPQPTVDPEIGTERPGDDVFIDVVLNWVP